MTPVAGHRWARAAAPGFVVFLVTAVAVQIAHPHAVAATPISAYLQGPGSDWLQGAYYVLAVALIMLAAAVLRACPPVWRFVSGVALAITGCAVVLVAYTYSPWPLPGNPDHRMRVAIHRVSALAAFLCATITLFSATPLLWRGRPRAVFLALAGVVLALELAGIFVPSYAPDAYGAFEKLSIAGIVFWLVAASLKLAAWSALPGGQLRQGSVGTRRR